MSMSFSLSPFYTIFHPPTKQKEVNQTLLSLENLIAVSKWHLAKLGEKEIRLCVFEVKHFGLQVKPAGQDASRSQGQTNNPSLLMMREKPQGLPPASPPEF